MRLRAGERTTGANAPAVNGASAGAPANDALRRLEARYPSLLPVVYGYCRARLPVHDAEDVTAEVFRAAVERLRNEPDVELTPGWFIAVCRSRIVDRWRYDSRWSSRLIDLAHSQPTIIDPHHDGGAILDALDRIPTLHRAVLVLHYVEGWSASEIGERLGRRPSAIDSLMARARRSLSSALDEAAPGEIREQDRPRHRPEEDRTGVTT